METFVKIENCAVKGQLKNVLKNVSWQMKDCESWLIIGANGSGKSEFVSALDSQNDAQLKFVPNELSVLEQKNATVTLAHSKTKNLSEITKKADIIVCATGKINTLTKDMVKKDVVIVDVGITKNEKGEIKGDVDFENVKEYASYITPVPKGVGPMTIACLMENTYELYLKRRG